MNLEKRKVLVLNKGCNAIGVVTLERAIIMLWSTYIDKNGKEQPKARIIDPTRSFQHFTWAEWSELKPHMGDDVIRSTNMVFRIPEIIILSRYDELPQHKIHFSRRTIYKRDENKCQYCGKTPGTEELSIDHIIPRSLGGKTVWENCVASCVSCNSRKADSPPDRTRILERVKGKDGKMRDVYIPAFIVYFKNKTKKVIKQPKKPNIPLFKGDIRVKSWEDFLGAAYWGTELENDNE